MRTKLALFDIDKTITKRDSMLQFVRYGVARRPLTALHLPVIVWSALCHKLGLLSADRAKESFFRGISRMDESDLERFYDEVLAKDLYRDAVAEMRARKVEGCTIVLVTASPDAYMKYFKKLGVVDEVIGTRLQQRNGRYTHAIEGRNCKGAEKAVRIEAYLKERELSIDFEGSSAYSDCMSDLPMLKLVKNGYLVHNDQGRAAGLEPIAWNA